MLNHGRISVFARLTLGMAAWLVAASLWAESPFIVDVWGTSARGPRAHELQQRLPQGSVFSVTQTRDGYLWFGTLKGLVRFDGERFTVFDESNTSGLPSDRILFLFEDRRGWLWVGTDGGGVALIRDGVVANLGFGAGSSEGRLMAACEDADGALWLYTADGQIGRFFDDGLAVVARSQPSLSRSLIADAGGYIWVGSDQGQIALSKVVSTNGVSFEPVAELKAAKLDFLLASRDGGFWRLADERIEKWSTNQLERVLGNYPWTNTPNARVTCACEDLQGHLVVGVLNAGVFWFDAAGKATRLSVEPSEGGLSHSGVLSVCLDREGDLWVGTDGGGLNRVKRRVGDVAPESQGRVVQSACEDAEGALWIGFNGQGVLRWKDGLRQNFGWDGAFRPEDGLISPNVLSVCADKSGQVWVGTRGSGGLHQFRDGRFQLIEVDGISGQEISALHQDRAGRIWVGTPNGLACWDAQAWKVFTSQDGLSTNAVHTIADDAAGNLWIGTVGGGLNQLRDGKFTVFRKSADGLPGDNVSALLVDGEGQLWVGTSRGLARFKNGHWARFTTSDGLVSNKINYLAEDDEGFLWIGSNAGLLRVAKSSLNESAAAIFWRVYDEADGLLTSECTDGSQPAAVRTRTGKLWFPTINGLVGIDPAELKRNTNQPPVMIESVLLDGREQLTNGLRAPLPAGVIVPPGTERLEIRFTSLNLASPERAQFRHQLEGHENSLTPAGGLRVATFTKLPPGPYRFRVIAANEDGVWNEAGASLAITVLPPFWQTGWFQTLVGLALLGAVVGVVHWISTQKLQRQLVRMRQKEALEKERSRIARDLHDQLGANLTQVSLLSELVADDKDQPAEVEAHARQIAKTAGETANALDEIVWAANPANDTLEGLANYICKYAQGFLETAGLRCRIEMPTALLATSIAPDFRHHVFLVVKEAVNNVVKHAQASSVWLRLRIEGHSLVLEVEDDGRGPEGAASATERGRNGLRNMSRRMEDVGGSFTLSSPASKRGTLVRLTAPLNRS